MEISLSRLLSAQENKLIGSSSNQQHYCNPYRPKAIVNGDLPVEECQTLRQERTQGKIKSVMASYWGAKALFGVASVEPLNLDPASPNYGMTIQDPILIELYSDECLTYDWREKFPFRRNEPRIRIGQHVAYIGKVEEVLEKGLKVILTQVSDNIISQACLPHRNDLSLIPGQKFEILYALNEESKPCFELIIVKE
ncbi:MAG: hypothetical protein Q8Q31_05160 [Nanoarchaeota archaeon]|nr:hypothetical protein [Nanoarchaeota archaeon]